jgi:spore maturation protein CgeB
VTDLLLANCRALAARDPGRADAVLAAAELATTVEASPGGSPTLAADGVLLHNRRAPEREARAWVARHGEALARGASTAVVFGFGLGYHIEALADAWDGRIVVVEPDTALLRAAFATRDLARVLARVELALQPLGDATIAGWETPVALLAHRPSLLRSPGLRALHERVAARTLLRDLRLRVAVVSPVAGGSHPIAGYCARALAALGHEVTILDLAPFAPGMETLGTLFPRRRTRDALQASYVRFIGEAVLAAVDALRPDLLLALAQAPLTTPVLAEIGRRGVVRAFWFVEDHRVFPYWRDVIGGYDWFFAIQRGDFLAEAGRLSGGRARYLPCAADPGIHAPLALDDAERAEWGAPVSFVGAGYRNRRLAFRSLLDLGLRIWGSDWTDAGPLAPLVQRDGARIATADAVRIFNATAVNLNLHSSPWVDGVEPRGDFVNPRTFELAAAGAFQLVDRRALLPELFVPDVEVATLGDATDLRERVRHWLDRPAERAAIAAAGRARVLAEHTYRHRMEALLEAVCGTDAARFAARPRETTVADVAAMEVQSALGALCRRLPAGTPFTLDAMARAIIAGEGDLSEPERLLLFLHQFDELYVREHRA